MASEDEVLPLAMTLLEALERRDYTIALGIVVMLATFVVTRLAAMKKFFPKDFTATALLGAAALGGFGAALAAGAPPIRSAVAFLVCSTTAIAFWEGIAKHIVKLWRWKQRRRRTPFTRKFPTLVCSAIVSVTCLSVPSAEAGEILEPGIVLTRPDGTHVRIEHETVLLDEKDVARIDDLVRDLEKCRKDRSDCEREARKTRVDRAWIVFATLAGAFVAGYCAERQADDSNGVLGAP